MMRISMDKRFKIGTVFNICLVVCFGLFAIYHLNAFDNTIKNTLESDIRLFLTSEKLTQDLQNLQQKYKNLTISPETAASNNIIRYGTALRSEFANLQNRLAGLIGSDSPLIKEINTRADLLAAALPAEKDAETVRTELYALLLKVNNEVLFYRNRNLEMLTVRKEGVSKVSKTFQGRLVLVTLITAVAAFAVLFFISQQIKLPTRKIIEIIRKIRDGNYAIPVRQHTGNEIDQIVSGLSNMAENLKIRDQLKLDKIQLEKKRFAALANYLSVPLLLINDERKAAFANDEMMTLFKLSWDEIYEVDLARLPLPVELKDKLSTMIFEKKWVDNEPCDIIGENYAFDLHLSLIPVKTPESASASIIIALGKIDSRKKAAAAFKGIL